MARIAGVDIPRDKQVETALTYIYGIGPTTSRAILARTNISPDTRVRLLTEDEVNRLREFIDREYRVEGDLYARLRRDYTTRWCRPCNRGHQAIIIPDWPTFCKLGIYL